MKRTLKMLFLLLFVSSVSFLSAQEGRDSKAENSKSTMKDKNTGDGGEVPTPDAKASPKNLPTPTKGTNVGQPDEKPSFTAKPAESKKGWLARIFGGKGKKPIKESDPE
jgi:hypothetical protein